jgi:transposase InsO family protein
MESVEVADLLGLNSTYTRDLATKLGWRFQEATCRGGRRKLYHRQDVLAYKSVRDGVSLGTLDPTLAAPVPAPEPTSALWASLSESARQEARERFEVVQALTTWRRGKLGNVATFAATWSAEHPDRAVSAPTVYAWERDWKAGGLEALVSGYKLRAAEGPKVPEPLAQYFDGLYLSQEQRSIRLCAELTRIRAKELGVECPSLKTWERHVQDIPRATRVGLREGNKALDDKCLAYLRRDREELRSNEIWVADHHQVDVAVLGPSGKPVFPWVTVFMDVRSWAYVGWNVCLSPNSDSIVTAFKRGVQRRGIPAELQLDNGKDFRSLDFAGGRMGKVRLELNQAAFESVVGRLGLAVRWARPYNARSKEIERTFRILKERFSRLWSTYRGGNTRERPERLKHLLKKTGEIPTLEQFDGLFGEWAEYVFNGMASDARGMEGRTRDEVFRACLGETRWAPPAELALLCMKTKVAKVGRNGVTLFGDQQYSGLQLFEHKGETVTVRYDPLDVDRVYVFDLEGRFICDAENLGFAGWHITAEEIRERERLYRQEKALVTNAARALEAQDEEPDYLRRVIAARKADGSEAGPGDPPEPGRQVVRPVAWGRKPMAKAVGSDLSDITDEDIARGFRLLRARDEARTQEEF